MPPHRRSRCRAVRPWLKNHTWRIVGLSKYGGKYLIHGVKINYNYNYTYLIYTHGYYVP